MQIQITQQDIDNGIKHSCTQCAGALAIARELGLPIDFVHVSLKTIRFFSLDLLSSINLPTPRPLQLFITAHDANARVYPMTFDLDLTEDQLLRLTHGIQGNKDTRSEEADSRSKESSLHIGAEGIIQESREDFFERINIKQTQEEQDSKRSEGRVENFKKGYGSEDR